MPTYDTDLAFTALNEHVREYFRGHEAEFKHWDVGPIRERVPDFHVFVAGPGPQMQAWTFVTSGCWEAANEEGHGLEFVLTAPDESPRHAEILAMTAFYHCGPTQQRLDLGHTVPIGEGWVEGSACDHLLVSLPYAYGPTLELCEWHTGHARLLSLLPITEDERQLKARDGLEALESRLEAAAIDYTDPARASVI